MKRIIIECDEERYLDSGAMKIRKDMERVAKIAEEWAEGGPFIKEMKKREAQMEALLAPPQAVESLFKMPKKAEIPMREQNVIPLELDASAAYRELDKVEKRTQEIQRKLSFHGAIVVKYENIPGQMPGIADEKSWGEQFEEDPLGTVFDGFLKSAEVLEAMNTFGKLGKSILKNEKVKEVGKYGKKVFSDIGSYFGEIPGSAALESDMAKRFGLDAFGKASGFLFGGSAIAGALTSLGAAGTINGILNGSEQLANGLTAENEYDKWHDIAGGTATLLGTGLGIYAGAPAGPGGMAIGGALGAGFGKLSGKIWDDKVADWLAWDDKTTSQYVNDGKNPYIVNSFEQATEIGNMIGDIAVQKATSDIFSGADMDSSTMITLTGEKRIEKMANLTPRDFGVADEIYGNVNIYLLANEIVTGTKNTKGRKGKRPENWSSIPKQYRGGLVGDTHHTGFADGGYVYGGAQLITVAEEGTPEAIIPLGRNRRKRALELFSQVGQYIEAPGFSPKAFASGGIAGGSISGGSGFGGSGPIIENCNIDIHVSAESGEALVESFRAHREELSEEVAAVFNAAFKGQFANTPASK
ncbi:hypothetical protein V1225_04420 [Emergencia sp. JLR.KK010]|uniref:hypothetical protein n=1 Tax=Emergencia sp. JLR.KK010 TaxID=3114296 RepID=UPI0030D0816B